MEWGKVLMLLGSVGLCLGFTMLSYRNTSVRGGNYFAYFNLLLAMWLGGELVKALNPSESESWRRTLSIFGFMPLSIMGFVSAINGQDLVRERRFLWGAAWALFVATIGLLAYDYLWKPVVSPFKIESPLHHLLTGGAVFFGIAGLAMLFMQWFRETGMSRKQTGAFFVAGVCLLLCMILQFVVPEKWAAYEMHLGGVTLYSFTLIWGHFRYGLFGLLPVSREALLEGLNEGVVVFNADGWIIDVNSTAFKFLGSERSLLGRKAADIVQNELGLSPDVIRQPEYRTEIQAGGGRWIYVTIAPAEGPTLNAYQADPGFDVFRTGLNALNPAPKSASNAVRILTIFDITSIKQAMEALHRSDQRLSLYVRRSPLPYIELDLQDNITDWNAAAEKVFGYTKQEVVGRALTQVLRFEDAEAWSLQQTTSGGRTMRVYTKSGTAVHGDFYATPLFDAENRPVGTAAMVIDVSNERHAKRQLQQKTAELESVFSALPDVFLRLQYNGVLTDFRAGRDLPAQWRNLLNESIGKNFLSPELAQEPLRTTLFEYWPQIRKIMRELEVLQIQRSLSVEVEYAGQAYAFEVRFVPIDAQEYIAVVRNVSEEWQARRALTLSEKQYRAVVEDQSEYICRYAPDLSLTFVNEAFCRQYARCDKNELIGVALEVLLPAGVRETFRRQTALFSPDNPGCEDVYATPTDKGLRWIQWKHRAIFDAEGRIVEYQSVGRDITERKKAQDELEYKNQVLSIYGAVFERLHRLHKGQSSSVLGDEENLKLLLRSYLRTVCESLGFDAGFIGTWNAPNFEVFTHYGQGGKPTVVHPEVFDDARAGSGENGPFAQMRSYALAPVLGEKQMFFVMGSFSERKTRFGEYEAEMAAMMADSIASLIALHRIERRRAQAEEALKQSELRFRTLATQTPDLILIYEQDGTKPVYSNRDVFLGFFLSPNEDFLSVLEENAADSTAWERFVGRACAFPEAYDEMAIFNANGDEEWVQMRSHALPGSRNHVIYVFSVVTAFKRQEEALLLHSSVLDQISTPVFAINANGQIIYWNRPAEEITQWTAKEVIGKVAQNLLLYKEEVTKINEAIEAVNLHERWDGELTLRRKDGSPQALLFNLSPVRNTHNAITGYVGIFMDVSERKKAEIALMEAKEAAEAATRAKSDFLATVSHEIRTPMNGVIGMTHLLRQTPLSADQADLVETIRISGERLLALLNDILDFSKIESGKMELESRAFQLKKAVQSAVELFSAEAARKKLYLKTVYSETLPEIIVGDDARLQQILINLVSNALKFTEKGGVTVKVDGRMEDGKVWLEFAVEDTGVGVPKEKQDRLFKPFSQVDASHTRRFGGTGLGLAICTRLVQLMGGKIGIDSEYTRGARFVFSAVFEIGRQQVHGPTQTFTFDPALAQKYPLQILVAEDNLINQKMIRMVLNRMGYQPVIVNNGVEAVESARRQAFDLIFMDVQMPEMDGITATLEILKTGLLKPVIVAMTANAMSSDKDECLAAGMSGFISKPIRIEQVHEALVQFGSRIPVKHLN